MDEPRLNDETGTTDSNRPFRQHVLVVAGMQRSGTSLTASMFEGAGVKMGAQLLPASSGNPKGFFEDVDFLHFHEHSLIANGIHPAGWTLKRGIRVPASMHERAQKIVEVHSRPDQVWGWKDPRTTLFLDFWEQALPEARFVFVFREPWEVIDSIYRRTDEVFPLPPEFALQFWENYNQHVVEFVSRHSEKCVLFELGDLVQMPRACFDVVRRKLKIPLGEPAPRYEHGMLRRLSSPQWRTMVETIASDTLDLYQQLRNLSRQTIKDVPGIDDSVFARIDKPANESLADSLAGRHHESQYSEHIRLLDIWAAHSSALKAANAAIRVEREALEAELSMRTSKDDAARLDLQRECEALRNELTELRNSLPVKLRARLGQYCVDQLVQPLVSIGRRALSRSTNKRRPKRH